MNKFVKTVVIGSSILMAIVFAFAGFVFYKLPDLSALSSIARIQTNSQNKLKSQNDSEAPSSAEVKPEPSSPFFGESKNEESIEKSNVIAQQMFDDFMSKDIPLSNFCGSLKNAKSGAFVEGEFSSALSKSIDKETQDPRIQAAKPLLRSILRMPSIEQLIADISKASKNGGQSLIDKASFYTQAYAAMLEMKEHKEELESVLDRGYLFLGLNNLIAKKPELANDPRVLRFCSNTEELFNQSVPVDFDREKNDFLNLLSESGVQASQISFDPNYKTVFDFKVDDRSFYLEGGWLDDLLRDDDEAQAIVN